MSRHIEQVNDLLREKLANLIAREVPLEDGLITVVYVDTSPDLKYARIAVSVLPEKYTGTVLEKLKKASGLFSKLIKKETRLRKVPRFNWAIDATEKEASSIEEILRRIREEENK